MMELTHQILKEEEYTIPNRPPVKAAFTSIKTAKLKATLAIIKETFELIGQPGVAFSGGSDSLVLLDLINKAGYFPFIIWADTTMEYPETVRHIEKVVKHYKGALHIATPNRTPQDQWKATGWPMLGKIAARNWMQKNRGRMGFQINVSECCRAMKIIPARILTRNLGCNMQITGQRGQADDNLRGLRTIKDGIISYQTKDNMWIANPLTGWTDSEIKGYIRDNRLIEHPTKIRGASTIGCVYCGGGSQYTNSGYRILRKTWPEAWERFMVKWGGGHIVLALKYKMHLYHVLKAVKEAGGLKKLAKNRPWIFDFTRLKPILGYRK